MAKQQGFEEGALRIEKLTFWEGVAIIVGANVGAGILGLAYGIRNAGWPVLVFWLVVVGFLTTASMLYVAETALRTKKPLQLSGLAEKYLGSLGSWLMFASVAINSVGCLIAYTNGSGRILSELLGVSQIMGSVIFFVPSIVIIWLGLRVTGIAEKVITFGMVVLVLVLITATIVGDYVKTENITYMNLYYSVPIFNIALFCYISQYAVPELTRGFIGENINKLPTAIITGLTITAILLALVPMSALGIGGPDAVSEVATIAWGQALGSWAFFTANGFALCAMITSFWAVGETFLTNIVDRLKFPSEWHFGYRSISLALVVIPPFALAYSGLVGFIDAIYFAGAFSGTIMSIIPVMMLREARKNGDREPEWTCGWWSNTLIQGILIVLFCAGSVYAVLDAMGILPSGW